MIAEGAYIWKLAATYLIFSFYIMIVEFTDTLPTDTILSPILISGLAHAGDTNHQYLILRDKSQVVSLYEIKYQWRCSPFKETLLVDNLLAVGFEGYFYLFDLETNQNMLKLKMNGYFGHLYYDSASFYVADANGIHCVNKNGNICWSNSELAIDGVIITEFRDNKILGTGEWDPPGGWEDFSINKTTGIKTS